MGYSKRVFGASLDYLNVSINFLMCLLPLLLFLVPHADGLAPHYLKVMNRDSVPVNLVWFSETNK